MKKQKYKKEDFVKKYKSIVNANQSNIPIFNNLNEKNKENIKTNSWFCIQKCESNNVYNMKPLNTDKLLKCDYKMIKIDMILNATHKMIFNNWSLNIIKLCEELY